MKTLMVMAGGTGGHVYPALAVAGSLLERGVNVVWLGTRTGLESRVVPAKALTSSGWRSRDCAAPGGFVYYSRQ